MYFPYSKNRGILRYFFDKQSSFYYEIVKVSASSTGGQHPAKHAIDFNASSYWLAGATADGTPGESIVLCLPAYNISLIGYEITTSYMGNRPTNWSFSALRDNLTFSEENYEYSMSVGQSLFVPYKHGPFQCFKYTINGLSPQGAYRYDIVQIELFGSIENLISCSNHGPCRRFLNASILLFTFLFAIK